MAEIGKIIFYDKNLSGSGRMSCASCHAPEQHYGPPGERSVFLGGLGLDQQGRRAVPTLTYAERRPNFSIGPDNAVSETAPTLSDTTATSATNRGSKSASNTSSSAANMVPQGGLFWDGRADTLQAQAEGPLFDPAEMAETHKQALTYLGRAPYAKNLRLLAGIPDGQAPELLLSEALFALARYQIEAKSFHLYNSKFDLWLEGKAKFSAQETEGYLAFNDPKRGNCGACHLDTPTPEGFPPLFTDHQYEALGVPRNMAITLNHNPNYYDLGVCDREPNGRKTLSAYCGMFATPTLRNSATRHVFFHNGIYHTLEQVLDFYALRDVQPERFYGSDAPNDLPKQYQDNLDRTDAPFGGKKGEKPQLSEHDRAAIVVFLKTLTDQPLQ
ncbi:cytochrome-c peroxidase [Neokomagataea tanensis]|uniref:Cytochrome-c peroxidase n=3 Tax=Acetobacteraceae TaxID=433 RepID=A0A4Y6V7E0_9PROT|nr:cytochrome-c peroxidase [Neokomagataea tanensis]